MADCCLFIISTHLTPFEFSIALHNIRKQKNSFRILNHQRISTRFKLLAPVNMYFKRWKKLTFFWQYRSVDSLAAAFDTDRIRSRRNQSKQLRGYGDRLKFCSVGIFRCGLSEVTFIHLAVKRWASPNASLTDYIWAHLWDANFAEHVRRHMRWIYFKRRLNSSSVSIWTSIRDMSTAEMMGKKL